MTDRIETLQDMLAADAEDADLPYMLALEHLKRGEHDRAVELLEETARRNPHYHYAYFQKAKAHSDAGRDAAALAACDEGIAQATKANDSKALGELQELRASLSE